MLLYFLNKSTFMTVFYLCVVEPRRTKDISVWNTDHGKMNVSHHFTRTALHELFTIYLINT